MARFNTTGHRAIPPVATTTSPIATVTATPNTRTFEGGPGFTRTAQAEAFLRATSGFHGGEASFYEDGKIRDERLRQLVAEIAVEDPAWVLNFATWLRGPGNIRTAALVVAVEFVKARLDAVESTRVYSPGPDGGKARIIEHYNRQIINAVCQRPDEPGELLAIWTSLYGRRIPKPVKRGLADAVRRCYGERSLLKYDTPSHAYRFGDILNLVHAAPDPNKSWQGDLFRYALDRRHNPSEARIPESLTMVWENSNLRKNIVDAPGLLYSPTVLRNAGMTWEDALSLAGDKIDKAKLWEALIPSMGIMALIRNLRNFDQTGVSDKAAQVVIDRLSDPEQIAKSKLFPFRFHTAYREAPSLRWGHALDKALTASLSNVPRLAGRTLIMVDTSSSMNDRVSEKSTVLRWDMATLFGVALGHRCTQADVVSFSSTAKYWGDPHGADTRVFALINGESLLRSIERWKNGGFFLGGGTDTALAVHRHFARHDRVVIITDEQTGSSGDPGAVIPRDVPMYTWNIAGYTAGHGPSGAHARFTFGGLTDKAFTQIPLLEAGAQGAWPWQVTATT